MDNDRGEVMWRWRSDGIGAVGDEMVMVGD